jgi:hypothetical protein
MIPFFLQLQQLAVVMVVGVLETKMVVAEVQAVVAQQIHKDLAVLEIPHLQPLLKEIMAVMVKQVMFQVAVVEEQVQ